MTKHIFLNKLFLVGVCLFFMVFVLPLVNAGFVVNHINYNEFDSLTQEQLDRVRALDWLWGHQSVGRIMMYGLDDLEALDSVKYGINIVPVSGEWQNFVTRQNYLDNSPMFGHIGMYEFWGFANANADLLDVAMMKYCYVNLDGGAHLTAASMFQEYKTNVNAFKLAHPEITLIHFTVPLTTGTDFYNSERSKYRDLILAEYGNEYVYDIADLESWNGTNYTTFNYLGTDYLRMNPNYTSDGGHPNAGGSSAILAKAWWVIMAKVSEDLVVSCSTGQTRNCTTSQSCPGTQICSGGVWGSCLDIAGDNCPDILAPSTITNLSVNSCTNNSCSLTWIAPGDNANTGTASQYDLRYSTSNITSTNFSSATQATGEPTPTTAGTTQNMTVTGLTSNTLYYFALKTADEIPNWSAISNVPSRTTTNTTCTSGQTQACTTTQSCPGTQTCTTTGTWGTCIDTPNDNCPSVVTPTISVSQLNPTENISIEQNIPFTFSTSVTCSQADCGNVIATLDPEITISVNQDNDDASVCGNSFMLSVFGYLGNSSGASCSTGLKFNDVLISQGSIINAASVELVSRGNHSNNATNLIIQSQTDDNPLIFSNLTEFNSRTRSTAFVEWNNVPAFTALQTYTTPDLTPIIQETINQTNWQEGDSIVIFLADNESTSDALRLAIDSSDEYYGTGNQAKLNITYSTNTNYKGIIPVGTGNPFYTTNSNPQTCSNMLAGDTCTNTWSVISTGTIGETYSFFVDYVPVNSSTQSKRTPVINIIISQGTSCEEDWECTNWSSCVGGNQTRTCTDLANCGTTNYKPFETQSCIECTNGTTQSCTTLLGNPGTQLCTNNLWGQCLGQCIPGTTETCSTPEGYTGTKTCQNNEQWGSCVFQLTDCVQGQINDWCECGTGVYQNGYCCQNEWRNTSCPTACGQGAITSECECDGSYYASGYCCNNTFQTTECVIPCTPEWQCENWNNVFCINNLKTRTCTDINDCGEPDYTQTQSCGNCSGTGNQICVHSEFNCIGFQTCENSFWSECIDFPLDNCPPCIDWQCSAWSTCVSGTQSRTCSDANQCGLVEPEVEERACGNCTNGTTINCTTSKSCDGTQLCENNFWGLCQDIENDNCPCISDWSCSNWSACANGTQIRTCNDLSECGLTQNNSKTESQACGECVTGSTRACITSQNCSGVQTCSNNLWGSCVDIQNDSCPGSVPSPVVKEFDLTINPSVLKHDQIFILTVTEKGIPLISTKIDYAGSSYYTKTDGTVSLHANKEFIFLTATRKDYKKQTISLNILLFDCGNSVCEEPYETFSSCPSDCKQVLQDLIIKTDLQEDTLFIQVTDSLGNPVKDAKVFYSDQEKLTDEQGKVFFTEIKELTRIKAEKLGFAIKTLNYVPSKECDEDNTKKCEIDSCEGIQLCVNGFWSGCEDIVGDNCPSKQQQGIDLILVFGAVIIIGAIAFFALKTIKLK